jgi:hypothetical protein
MFLLSHLSWESVGLRWTGAGLLGVAAVAKAWQVPILLRGDGILSNPFLLDAVIVFEVVAAAIILVSSFRVCWWMIVAVFGSFSVVSAIALLIGSDCNCFGTWGGAMVTLPIDLGMLVTCAFVWWRGDADKMGISELSRSELETHVSQHTKVASRLQIVPSGERGITKRFALFRYGWCAGILLGFVVALGLVSLGHYRLQASASDDGTQFLLASQMIGKPWPIRARMNAKLKEVETGKWLVVVVRRDCDHCARLLRETFSDPLWSPMNSRTVLFVSGNNEWTFYLDRLSWDGEPSGIVNWVSEPFVASPALIMLSDGFVADGADGAEADAFAQRIIEL